MATAKTQWPSPSFPESTKALLAKLLDLIESKEPDVGQRLATEVSHYNCYDTSGLQKFSGTKEIIASRAHAWEFITSRKHEVLAVFEANTADPGMSIMLDVTLELVLKNGKELLVEFGAREEVVGEAEEARLQSFIVYTDSAPLREVVTGTGAK